MKFKNILFILGILLFAGYSTSCSGNIILPSNTSENTSSEHSEISDSESSDIDLESSILESSDINSETSDSEFNDISIESSDSESSEDSSSEHVHEYVEIKTNPTCTTKGYTIHICSCSEFYIDSYVDALEHNYRSWIFISEPTIENSGYATSVCLNDATHIANVEVPALNDKSVWTISNKIDPTLEDEGSYTYSSIYGDKEIQIPSLSDETVWSVKSTPATCEEDGETIYSSIYGEVNIIHKQTGHNYGEWEIVDNPTMTSNGSVRHVCSNDASHIETKVLNNLLDEEFWTLDDTFEPEMPTLTETGRARLKCEYITIEVEIPVLTNTTFWTKTTLEIPGCTTSGQDKYVGFYEAVVIIDLEPTGHINLTHVPSIPSTCEEDGVFEHYYCEDCDRYYSDEEATIEMSQEDTIDPKDGHDYGEWEIVDNPTMTSNGSAMQVCKNDSNHKIIVDIPSLSDETVWTVKSSIPATCEEDGETVYSSIYGEVNITHKQTGHDYGEWEIVDNPTMTSNGSVKHVCSNDTSHVETKILNNLLDEEFWTLDDTFEPEMPTLTETGRARLKCEYITIEVEIPVLTNTTFWTKTTLEIPGCTTSGQDKYVGFYEAVVIIDLEPTGHINLTHVPSIPSTCEEDGVIEHYYCEDCGRYYSDEEATNEINQEDTIDLKDGHDFIYGKCNSCGKELDPTEGLQYELIDNSYYSVSLGNATDSNIVIPSTYNDLPVKTIGDRAFYSCNFISTIVIPYGVTSIGSSAFAGSSLTSIDLPSSVTNIGNDAFYRCSLLNAVYIPNSVISLGERTFFACNSLTIIEIPYGITNIGEYTFAGTSITSICIPDSVISVGEYAFWECESLVSITIPFIGQNADGSGATHFGYLFGASSYSSNKDYVPSSLKEVIITGGTSIEQYAFSGCSSLTSIEIPNSVTSIGRYAFQNCNSLVTITIPFVGQNADGSGATNFGYIFGANSYTYNNDYVPSSLKKVIITGGTSIENYAFEYCTSLTSIEIPSSATIIGDYVFYGCSSLTSIVIPESVISIGEGSFYYCSSLENVYYKGTIEDWCNIEFIYYGYANPMYYASHFYMLNANNEWYEVTEIEIPSTITNIGIQQFYGFSNVTSIVIPESVTSIGSYAFYGCNSLVAITIPFVGQNADGSGATNFGYIFGESYNVPNTLKEVIITGGTSIGENAFTHCSSLTLIEIPNSIISIRDRAFYGCSSLTSINIPDNITNIGDSAFAYCSSLTSFTIPSSVTYLGYEMLFNCSSLQNLYYGGTIEKWCSFNFSGMYSNPLWYVKKLFMLDENKNWFEVNSIEIPDTVTKIGDYQFAGFINLISLKIPSSVTNIGLYSFAQCTNLTSVTFDNGLSNIDGMAFALCTSLKEITLPKSLKNIGIQAFYYCTDLAEIYIDSSVESIGLAAFSGCTGLEKIIVDSNNLVYDSRNNCNAIIESATNTLIIGCNNTTVPDGVIHIGMGAFIGCTFTTIELPDSLISIGNSAFGQCANLTSIVIPNNVTTIESSTFYGCDSLENVYYRGTIEDWCNIEFDSSSSNPAYNAEHLYLLDENNEWYDLKSITELYIPNTVKEIKSYQFYGCSSVSSIIIPSSVISMENYAFDGCSNLEKVYYKGTIEDWCNIEFDSSSSNPMYYASYFFMLNENNEWYEPTIIEIPDTIISIGNYQFYKFDNVTEIIISNNVTCIKDYAFNYCSSLKNVIFESESQLSTIESAAFYGCSSLTNISIPSSVISIESSTFVGCSSLTSIVIPESITSMEMGVFSGCNSLKSITIPFVGQYADGSGKTYFGYIFGASSYSNNYDYVPSSLKEVIITGGTSIESFAFAGCSSITTIEISDSFTSIGERAFVGCNFLENVYYRGTIEDWCNIEFVSEFASPMSYAKHFYMLNENNEWCEVTEIEIPNTVEHIGKYQFYGFDNLKEVIISGGQSVGERAFQGCSSLTSIEMPSSIINLGDYAFDCCDSLENVYYEGTIEDWCNIEFISAYNYSNPMSYASHFYILNENNEWYEVTEIEIPNTVTHIGKYQFCGFDSIISFIIPNSVTTIGEAAFQECSALKSISLPFIGQNADGSGATHFGYIFGASSYSSNNYYVPSSLKEVIITGGQSIGERAFQGCSSLTAIEIPSSVTSIGEYAFYGCGLLISIEISDSITSIGDFAFDRCNSLENVYYRGTIEDWCNIEFVSEFASPMSYAKHFYMLNENNEWCEVTEIEIPSTITIIGSYTFFGFNNVTSFVIPESIINIESYAFYNCYSLTSIILPNSLISIGEAVFQGCSSLKSISLPFVGQNADGSGETHLRYIFGNENSININKVIITGGQSISYDAFKGCGSLTSIEIPSSIIEFIEPLHPINGNITSLDNVYYRGTIEDWINIEFVSEFATPMYNAEHFYILNENNEWYEVTEIEIPNTVAHIGKYQFYGFDNLKEVIISNGVAYIDEYSFSKCSSLTTIKIPSSVTCIKDYAFNYCISLKNVIFAAESQLSIIEYGSFYGCSSLTHITIPSSVISVEEIAFYGCGSLESVIFETGSQLSIIGYRAFANCNSLVTITIPFVGQNADGSGATNFGYIFGASSSSYNGDYVPSSLKEVIITGGTSIGFGAFSSCHSLVTIIIPNSIIRIEGLVFSWCDALENIYYKGTIEDWYNIELEDSSSHPVYNAEHFYVLNENNEWYEVTEI